MGDTRRYTRLCPVGHNSTLLCLQDDRASEESRLMYPVGLQGSLTVESQRHPERVPRGGDEL